MSFLGGSLSFEHMILLDRKLKDLHGSCSLCSTVQGRSSARRKEEGGKDFKICESVLGL